MKRAPCPTPIPIGSAAKAAAQKMWEVEKVKLTSEHGDVPSSIELWAAFKRSKIMGEEGELTKHAQWRRTGGYSFKGSPRHTVCWNNGPVNAAEKSVLIKNVAETGQKAVHI